ncbi:MAG: Hint domain-containing protein [Clostridia bacterium]|nr:Hint domain-containing protein [Clostridia bacterium]
MQCCLSQDTSIIIKDEEGQILHVNLGYFDPVIEEDSLEHSLSQFKVLTRAGWTELLSIGRRQLWEGEPLFHVKTRLGRLSLTGEQKLVVRRGVDEAILQAQELKAGDALLMRDPPKLGKKAPLVNLEAQYRAYGVLSVDRTTGYLGYIYEIDTEDHTLVANEFLVRCM